MFDCETKTVQSLHRRGDCSPRVARLVPVFVMVSFVLCIATPLVLWSGRINRSILRRVGDSDSCPPCYCDCFYQDFLANPCRRTHSSKELTDGRETDPENTEEMNKDMVTLIKEELSLQKIVPEDDMQRYESLIIDAKKASSHYQREAEKCNIGVMVCEEGRERAQEELVRERKLTAIWEQRAHMLTEP